MISCLLCEGTGRRWYSDTSTWHHVLAGQSFTEGVCDTCWGSGDLSAPGLNLREQKATAQTEWERRYREDPAFRWKERARRFRRRAYNHRENYRSIIKYELEPLRAQLLRTLIDRDRWRESWENDRNYALAMIEAHRDAWKKLNDATKLQPREEWHEDLGDALWWKLPIVEPPYLGSPLDEDFPEYVTHWTPLLVPSEEEMNRAMRTRTKETP